jgi:hypothetical protein
MVKKKIISPCGQNFELQNFCNTGYLTGGPAYSEECLSLM